MMHTGTHVYIAYISFPIGGYRGGGYFDPIIFFSGLVSAITEMTPLWCSYDRKGIDYDSCSVT